jgi:L-lactate dehydrogenase complex protein LldE
MRIGLFITCFNDTLFPGTGQAVVRVLERLGHEVDFPLEQTCCGQMLSNTGYQLEAVPLARRFVRVFGDQDAIVCPSGSCTAMVIEQYPRLAELGRDPGLAAEVDAVTAKVHEFSSFLTDVLEVEDVGAYFPHRVTYHPTCHSLRGLGIDEGPLRLLRAVRGIDLVELPAARQCCGFGGTFAVKNPDVSTAMDADKLTHVLATGAEVCTALDNSCLMHIGGAVSRLQAGVRTMHVAEILAADGGDAASQLAGSQAGRTT